MKRIASLIEVRVQIDQAVYSLQAVGAADDAMFAVQVGRAVSEAIIAHGMNQPNGDQR